MTFNFCSYWKILEILTDDGEVACYYSELMYAMCKRIYIQAQTNKERDIVRLNVEKESFPALVFAPQSPSSSLWWKAGVGSDSKDESGIGAFIEKAEQRAKYDEDIWTLYIEEVTITAPKPKK